MSPKLLAACFFLVATALAYPAAGRAQSQLLLNGTFATLPSFATTTYSSNVGRSGSGAAYILDGTTGSTGWTTTESDALFEIWAPGYAGSPTTVGNTLELANNSHGNTTYQDAASSVGGGDSAVFSFGYSARNAGQDSFTVTITDQTAGTTVLTANLNPTDPFATVDAFTSSFAITPGDTFRVAFVDTNTTASGKQSAHIDEVSLTQVPEPSVGVLAGVGGLVVLAARRFRRGGRVG